MCRFAAFFGKKSVRMDSVLTQPANSLIAQSHKINDQEKMQLNADGFGVAWYNPSFSLSPGLFKSIQPAWNDDNFFHLVQHIASPCFIGHIRASTVGDVNQHNCHPFAMNQYAFAHNGTVRHFERYKKKFIHALDEDLFLTIRGNTDSEYVFAMIMHFLRRDASLVSACKKTIAWIYQAQEVHHDFSRMNMIITDGNELIATRYVSRGETPLSLSYCMQEKPSPYWMISSEPLDPKDITWHRFPDNHLLRIAMDDMQGAFLPID